MAELRFDITATDAGASRAMKSVAGSADLAAQGARRLAEELDHQRRATQASVGATLALAKADKILAGAEDELSGKAEEAALALRIQAEQEKKAREQADKLALAQGRISSATSKLSGIGFLQPSKLALLPALIPVTAAVAQGVGAIAVSFGAAGAALAGFGALAGTVLAQASQDAQKLAQLNLRLNTATTASAKKAIREQITQLTSSWTPAYKQVMGNLETLKTEWKSLATSTAAPALVPWLAAAARGLKLIQPALKPVADLFQGLGESLNAA